ncbi:MAG: UDP-N-acetylmuramoyl-L-alanyl-D-glutamate--2,6-diaminopimelate ligase [Actinomycetia bacterium]|nr:UDP-N-acetylmuramoyl-L-alanyl-D-glutamate--2,6-diaminopimelate ligase [Actinomycetes bacterium]
MSTHTRRTPRPTPRPTCLGVVCAALSVDPGSVADLVVTGVTLDSRDVRDGDLFVALTGERVHGATFAAQAAQSGAVAVATDVAGASLVDSILPCLVIDDLRARVGELAAEIYGRPAADLLVLGVTGTNGKTTTSYLLESGLRAAGHRTGLVGTVATLIDGEAFETVRTTPEAPELHALLAVMRERGVTAVAMEVSSHALAMGRVDGCHFDVAGFTQLAVDHQDFHGSQEAYFAAKQALFQPALSKAAVIVIDDDGGRQMAQAAKTESVTVGMSSDADWVIGDVRERRGGGHDFALTDQGGSVQPGRVRLMGRFNVTNAALAQVMLATAGVDPEAAARGVGECRGVPGRMERIGPDEVALVVDYAHTTDALGRAIDAVTPDAGGDVIVVFGCGGDRDASKREPMGAVAAARAAVVVVTDDNPRSEPPDVIRQAVLAGTAQVPAPGRAEVIEVEDRRVAMEVAVRRARPGDVVLVAGKGHESGQEVGSAVTLFDDRVELLAAWQRVRGHSAGGQA